jgi:hypothetical protein
MNYSIGILVVCVAVLCGDFSPKCELSWRWCGWGGGNAKSHNELDAGGKKVRHYRDTVSGESAGKPPFFALYDSFRGSANERVPARQETLAFNQLNATPAAIPAVNLCLVYRPWNSVRAVDYLRVSLGSDLECMPLVENENGMLNSSFLRSIES